MKAPAQVPGDLAEPPPVGQQAVHDCVVAPGAVGVLARWLWPRAGSRFRRQHRLLSGGGHGTGFREAGAVRGDAPPDRLGQVLPQVEPVGDLHRVRCAGAGPVGVGAGAVPADDLDAGMGGQPVRQRLGVAASQQVQRRTGLAVDDDRAVVVAAPDGEVVHPEHPRDGRRRVRGGHHQPQQHLPAGRLGQGGSQPGPGPPGQRDRDVPQHAGQQRSLPAVADGQARDLLSERRALAAGAAAEEPADGQPDHHPAPADGGISQPPGVTAVHPADTAPHAVHGADSPAARASTSSSPAAATTLSTTTPARWGRRIPSSTTPGHDKHPSPCENDTTDSWKNGRPRQPPHYQESTRFTRQTADLPSRETARYRRHRCHHEIGARSQTKPS